MVNRKSCKTDAVLGALIRQRRKVRGLSQQALAISLGISFQQVQKYERGVNRMSVAMFLKTARLLGTEPSALLQEVDRRL